MMSLAGASGEASRTPASQDPNGHSAAYPSLPAAPRLSPRCVNCGSLPTAWADFRVQHGYIVLRRVFTYRGPFCRDCGIATFRKTTAKTLIMGWWGFISLITTPWYLITNLVSRRQVANLAAPQPEREGRTPLPIGRPVYLRWQIIGVLFPFIVIALIVAIFRAQMNRAG